MRFFIFIFFIFVSNTILSNEVEVIQLHENKSLDQLVIDQLEDNKDANINSNDENLVIEETSDNASSQEGGFVSENEIDIYDSIWKDLNQNEIKQILNNSLNISSNYLQNEFNNSLLNVNLDFSEKENRDIFLDIVNYFFNVGDITNAYNLIKSRNLENDENKNYYESIELNYLLSTYQLESACNFNSELILDSNKYNITDKVEIFCLILDNKLSEAELLYSIMLETDTDIDKNYEELLLFLINNDDDKKKNKFKFRYKLNPDFTYLYSAMARIAEIPLNENFLKSDSINMAIPIILNKSTPIDLRLKAAHKSFDNGDLTAESLAALYQSVDYNSNQLNNKDQTIKDLNNNIELLMSYYFQLINIQIFPSERVEALIEFWDFAEKNNLEEIAYSLSYKIIDSIEISSEYSQHSLKIAKSYIYIKDFEKASKWINFYENTNDVDENSSFLKILLNLYSLDDIDLIVEVIGTNFESLTNIDNKKNEELIFILLNALDGQKNQNLNSYFEKIYDDRKMPSIFLIENIKKSIETKNERMLLIYSVLSLNNKEWIDLHPLHLKMILESQLVYKNGEYVKNIILEIFKNYKII